MARTYKKSAKSEPAETNKLTPIEVALGAGTVAEKPAAAKASIEKPATEKPARTASRQAKPSSSVIAAPSDAVVGQIVYQPSSQILTRKVGPNESFGVGDDMPIYYL